MTALRLLIVASVVALHPAPAPAQISILGLKNSLVQFALDRLSTPDEFEITAGGVEEPEDGVTELVDVRIRDRQGVWFEAEGIAVNWSPSRILVGNLQINSLVARGVRVLRTPVQAPAPAEDEAAAGTEESAGFQWPRAPLTVRVDEMRLDGVFLAPGVIGADSIRFNATGSARDAGDEQAATLALTRTDEIEGTIDLDYLRDFADGTLAVDLAAREAPGGLVAGLLGLPETAASRVALNAEGPLDDWRVTLDAEAEDTLTLAGQGMIDLGPPFRLDATATAEPGPLLPAEARAALAPAAELRVLAEEGADGVIGIETARLTAPALDASVDGTFARATGALDATVALEARAALSALAPGVDFERVAFDGTASGSLADLRAEGALALDGIATDPVDLAEGRFSASATYAPDAIGFALDGSAAGLRLDQLQPETVGPAEVGVAGTLAGETLALDRLSIESALLSLNASGTLAPDGAGIDYALDAPDLAPVAAAYDVDAAGALSVAGRVEGDLAAPRIEGEARLQDLDYQGEDWGRVALTHDVTLGAAPQGDVALAAEGTPYGPARVATAFRLEDQTLSLSDLSAEALGLRIAGAVAYGLDDGLADGTLDLSTTDLAALGAQAGAALEGSASGRVVLSAEDGGQTVDADLEGAGLAGYGARVGAFALDATVTDALRAPSGEGRLSLTDVAYEEARLASLGFDGRAERRDGVLIAEGDLSAEGLDAFGAQVASLTATLDAEDLAGAPAATLDATATGLAYAPADARVARLRFEGRAEDLTGSPSATGTLTVEDAAGAGATLARLVVEGRGETLIDSPSVAVTATAESLAYPPAEAEIGLASFEGSAEDLTGAASAEGRLVLDAVRGAGVEAARVAFEGSGADLTGSRSAQGTLTVDALAYPGADATVERIALDFEGDDLTGDVDASGTLTAAAISAAGATASALEATFSGAGLTTPTPVAELDARLSDVGAPGAASGAATLTAALTEADGGRLTASLATEPVRLDAGRIGAVALDVAATGVHSGDLAVDGAARLSDAVFANARIDRVEATARGPLSGVTTTLAARGAVGDAAETVEAAMEEGRRTPVRLDARAVIDAAEPGVVEADLSAFAVAYGDAEARLTRPARIRSAEGAVAAEGVALDFPGGALEADVTSHGTGFSGEAALRLEDFPVLAELTGAPIAAGRARLDARFDTRPGSASGTLALSADGLRFSASDPSFATQGFSLDADGRWNGARAALDATVTGPFEQPLTAEVALPLTAPDGVPAVPAGARLDGRVRWSGRIDQIWALVPAPDHVLRGQADIDLALTGPLDAIDPSGRVSLTDGSYENLLLGTILTDLTLRSDLAEDGRALALILSAEDGAGHPLAAEIALDDGALDATLTADGAVLVRRREATAAISAGIAAAGAFDEGIAVEGTVTVDRAEVRLVSDLPPTVPDLGEIRIKGVEVVEEEEQAGLLSNVTLDVAVGADDDVFVRGRGLDSEWRIGLQVDGTAQDPLISGDIERIRGVLNLVGFPFDLERGAIRFRGETPPDPALDIALTRENDGVTGGIFVGGYASEPEISFRSRPDLPESEVLPRVLFGKSEQSLTAGEALQLAAGLTVLLDGAGDFGLGSIRSATGLDVLRLEMEGEQTSAVLGSNLTEDVFVGLKQPVDGGPARVQVEVEVYDNVTVDSEVGGDAGESIGVNWKYDF